MLSKLVGFFVVVGLVLVFVFCLFSVCLFFFYTGILHRGCHKNKLSTKERGLLLHCFKEAFNSVVESSVL